MVLVLYKHVFGSLQFDHHYEREKRIQSRWYSFV